MAKTPVAKPNVTVTAGRSPFMPAVFIQQPAALLGGGGATPYVGPREDGCHAYLNYDAVTPIFYNGQNQTKLINQTFRP